MNKITDAKPLVHGVSDTASREDSSNAGGPDHLRLGNSTTAELQLEFDRAEARKLAKEKAARAKMRIPRNGPPVVYLEALTMGRYIARPKGGSWRTLSAAMGLKDAVAQHNLCTRLYKVTGDEDGVNRGLAYIWAAQPQDLEDVEAALRRFYLNNFLEKVAADHYPGMPFDEVEKRVAVATKLSKAACEEVDTLGKRRADAQQKLIDVSPPRASKARKRTARLPK